MGTPHLWGWKLTGRVQASIRGTPSPGTADPAAICAGGAAAAGVVRFE
jgi:hypothetical protein